MEKNLKLIHPKDGSLCYTLETNRTAQIILQHKLKKLSSHLLMTDWAQQIFIFTHIIYLELFLVKKILYTCTYICTTYKTKYMSVCVCELRPTLSNPMDYSPPGSSIRGVLQARTLEWVTISFSRGSPQPRDRTWVSHCRPILYCLSHREALCKYKK